MMQNILIENVELALKHLFADSIKTAFPTVQCPEILITPGRVSEFQCNNAMGLVKLLSQQNPPIKANALEVGATLVRSMPPNNMIEKLEPTPQGFINVAIRKEWVAETVVRVAKRGVLPPEVPKEKILVDFSSPNIAKEMHVGHLRSTIIGECLCRLFEFLNHEVHRVNHVGDWGTQFGMLCLYLKMQHPNFLTEPPHISDLQAFYRAAKKMFDEDAEFKENARREVVKLQSYEESTIKAWQMICDISRKEFQEIYNRLDVTLEERGESFYNPLIPQVLDMLEKDGVTEMSDGAQVIIAREEKDASNLEQKDMVKVLSSNLVKLPRGGGFEFHEALIDILTRGKILIETDKNEKALVLGKKETKLLSKFDPQKDIDKLAKAMEPLYKGKLDDALAAVLTQQGMLANGKIRVPKFPIPLMMRKSDGGFTYDTTDVAAMYHRFVQEKCNRVVYVTDVGQFDHFKMVAQLAQDVGWMTGARWQHAGFGLVSGEDGKKLKTRSGETFKLRDLLDEAVDRSFATLQEREQTEQKQGHSEEEMRAMAKQIGYGAVKYFDLKQNRTTDYSFSFDKMLDMSGNTAVYLFYSYARICSIKRRVGLSDEEIYASDVVISCDKEKQLALCAFKFGSVILRTAEDLMPNHLTDYAYELVNRLTDFYGECKVVGHELQNSRLLLIELVRVTLLQVLRIIGIEPCEKM